MSEHDNGGPVKTVHFDRRVTISDLITLLVLVGGGLITITTIEANTKAQETRLDRMLQRQEQIDKTQDYSVQRFRDEMRSDVRDIQQKLDRLVESQLNR